MTPLQLLKQSRQYLSNEANWYKGGCFPDSTVKIFPDDYKPPCMCAWFTVRASARGGKVGGGIDPVAAEACYIALRTLDKQARTPTGEYNLIKFNDLPTTTHADILRVFDLAIASLEAK